MVRRGRGGDDEARLAQTQVRRWWVCDQVEALLALDRVDDAVRVLDAWEAASDRRATTGRSRT